MDESCRELLSRSVITPEQYQKLLESELQASAPKIWEEAWLEVANKVRKNTQKYQELMDVLQEYEEMSPVVRMLETKFGKIALITSNNIFF